ncbi:MAG: HIT family protein [Thermoprotei archaeon]|nr:MAG: HIT family protein [Thermoprotei archaeon]
MEDCVFCRIARDEAPAFVVYKDKEVIAFLDKAPVTRGHTLVATVNHYESILDVPDDLLGRAMRVVKRVAKAQLRGLGADGVRIVQNNGSLAGQVIFHIHFHVIPCYRHERPLRRSLGREEGYEVSRILRSHLGDDGHG